jgi:hypothetical protein
VKEQGRLSAKRTIHMRVSYFPEPKPSLRKESITTRSSASRRRLDPFRRMLRVSVA